MLQWRGVKSLSKLTKAAQGRRLGSVGPNRNRCDGVYNMRKSVTQPNMQRIRAVAQQIVERFSPQRVVLFGSYAYGHPTADSDVDLLVVLDTTSSPLQSAATISKAIDHPFPLDILVMSPSDLQDYLRENAMFPRQIAERGIVRYETGHARVG